MATQTAKRPVHEIRLGRLKATIWENDTKDGIRHNISLSRIYKEGNQWKDSTSFGRDDLPLVMKVADMAHTWVYENGNSSALVAAAASGDEY
jgi:hypothetical protein